MAHHYSVLMLDGTTRDIKLTPSHVGVMVELSTMNRYDRFSAYLLWDQVPDVESLSEIFDTEMVRTFKVIVDSLSEIYRRKDTYKA